MDSQKFISEQFFMTRLLRLTCQTRLPPSGSVSSSSSVSQMASGVSLVSFNSRGLEGMHQRSYSVSSADQWTDATVIANSGVSTGTKLMLSVCEMVTGVKQFFGLI